MPEWYPLVAAAHYLHVPPWELAERPSVWVEWALAAAGIDAQVEAERTSKLFGGKK